jgi:hypothetical protein
MKYLLKFIILLIAVLSIGSSLYADTDLDAGINEELLTEDNAKINIYGGYFVNHWKINSSIFTDISYNNEPYKILQFGAKTNYSFLSFGIEYSNSEFSSTGTLFDNDSKAWGKQSHFAEQLKIFNGMTFGKLSLYIAASLQKYNTTGTLNDSNPLYYYSEKEGIIVLNQNDKINWYSDYKQFDVRLQYSVFDGATGAFGIRYSIFEAPTEVFITSNDDPAKHTGEILLYTKNKIFDTYFGASIKGYQSKHFYTLFSISGSFLFTSYYPENKYFDIEYKNPFSFDSFSISGIYTASFSLNFKWEHIRIQTGIGVDCSIANLTYDKTTLKNDTSATDQSGNTVVYNSGEDVELEFKRTDIFWGYFINASAFF